jgi:hypothetical protein
MEHIKPILPPTIINNEDIYQHVRDMVHETFFVPHIDMARVNETEVRLRMQCEALAKDIEKRMMDKLLNP